MTSTSSDTEVPPTIPSTETIRTAYLYLLGRALAIQQENVDVDEVPYNVIKHNPLGSESADFVNPNLDVAYWEAWIAVDDDHAVILDIPEIRDRYYTVQIMDGWAEVIANVNERTYPDRPYGPVAFVTPGSNAAVPGDAIRIEAPAGKVKVLGRVELSSDPAGALALQHRFTLRVPEGIVVDPAPALPAFPSPQLPDAWIFTTAPAVLASCPDTMADAPRLQSLVTEVAAYARSGDEAIASLQAMIDEQVKPHFFQLIAERPSPGGWAIMESGGRFGNDYTLRAICNFGGIWANVPEEALYYTAHSDADGAKLSGSRHYTLHFEADALPTSVCSSFWSVTMLRMPDYRVAPNALNKYSINNVTGSQLGADGSLTLHIAPELPDGVPAENWLPAPRDTQIFLCLRLYEPTADAIEQRWYASPVRPVAS